jgi:DNA-binding LacI/PurR family transcriptional regulator
MADVATVAGVSAQTVSRVSNGRENVDPLTRERVREAMAALGYRPNSAARSLATGSFRSIGVIASTLTTFGAQQVLDGVADEARRWGYDVVLVPLKAPSPEEVSGAADVMSGRHNVDALVVGVESGVLESLFGGFHVDVPIVVTDGGARHPRFPTADSDPEPGLRAALTHLISGGHTRIWHAGGPPDSNSAIHRREIWEQVLREHGLPAQTCLATDWSSESGHAAGLVVAAATPRPTAVLCANDQTALGLIRALTDLGVRVPEDVSVVGFDDVEAARFSVPRLSTVRHDIQEVGRRAVRTLIKELSPTAEVGPLGLVPSVFVDRESTAPLTAPNP